MNLNLSSMIKKFTTILVFAFIAINSYGQTIVSTSPEDQKVVLEEFTGIYCVFCPQGHAIAQSIQDNNPGDVFLVNIHVGGFAAPSGGDPDFRSPFGTGIANQSGLIGYPAGTVNRRNFPGLEQGAAGSTAMSRGSWNNASNQVLGGASDVNVAVEAEINVQTNELTVHVEGYYTADSPQATNLLNVALLQNNTKGPQTGGNAGNEYNHMHRLVHMVTGQWGISIPTTTMNTFVDETMTYTLPADYNGLPVELADIEVVAFISETQQLISSGSGAYPTFTGITLVNDANLRYLEDLEDSCSGIVNPIVNIQNTGQEPITALEITYSINSGTQMVYNWTGNLTSLQSETIELPELSYSTQAINTIAVSIPNDDENTNNDASTSFEQALDATSTIDMELNTDNYGSEVRWNVTDFGGAVLYNGGPYGNNQTINETFNLPESCYTFNLIDTYGDGGGQVTLTDSDGTEVFYTNGVYGSGASKNFSTDGFTILGLGDNALEAVGIYPNPATSVLNIDHAENASIEVYNMLGQTLYRKTNISLNEQVNVSNLTEGTYFVKITNGNAVKTAKFIKG
jgi:hypothetical protein